MATSAASPRSRSRLQRLFFVGLGAILLHACPAAAELRFSNVFQSHMVLQRGQPLTVWGYGALKGDKVQVDLTPHGSAPATSSTVYADGSGHWSAVLDELGDNFTGVPMGLMLSRAGDPVPWHILEDVVLGDVYLFAGQSNADLPEAYVHQFDPKAQREEERLAEAFSRTGKLRGMIVPIRCGLNYANGEVLPELTESDSCRPCPWPWGPQSGVNHCNYVAPPRHGGSYSYCSCESLKWTRLSGDLLRGFSAIAWFMGKVLAASRATHGIPIGLVRSSRGATSIATWSSPDAVAKCPQSGGPVEPFLPFLQTQLYNHMIHPLLGLKWASIVWVHGARNLGPESPFMGSKYYRCALKALVSDWRQKMRQPSVPFLVVEMPVFCNEDDYKTWHVWCAGRHSDLVEPDEHLPKMRLAQAESEDLPHTHLVSSMDRGSLQRVMGGNIHSSKKMVLGRRLAQAALKFAYKDKCAVWSGPVAVAAWRTHRSHVSVCFDTRGGGPLELNMSMRCPKEVLRVYCTGKSFEMRVGGHWVPAASAHLEADGRTVQLAAPGGREADRVRYAWADWPLCVLRSGAKLPARVFDLHVQMSGEPRCPEVHAACGKETSDAEPSSDPDLGLPGLELPDLEMHRSSTPSEMTSSSSRDRDSPTQADSKLHRSIAASSSSSGDRGSSSPAADGLRQVIAASVASSAGGTTTTTTTTTAAGSLPSTSSDPWTTAFAATEDLNFWLLTLLGVVVVVALSICCFLKRGQSTRSFEKTVPRLPGVKVLSLPLTEARPSEEASAFGSDFMFRPVLDGEAETRSKRANDAGRKSFEKLPLLG